MRGFFGDETVEIDKNAAGLLLQDLCPVRAAKGEAKYLAGRVVSLLGPGECGKGDHADPLTCETRRHPLQ